MLTRCMSGYALPAVFLLLSVFAVESQGDEARIYEGSANNVAADSSSQMRLELAISGEAVSGSMVAYSPLNHSGRIEGNLTYNMCKLQGRTDDGAQIELSGALDGKSYEGSYTITFPDGTLEYGNFNMQAVSIVVKNPVSKPKALVSRGVAAVNKPEPAQKKVQIRAVNRVSAPPN